MLVKLLNIRLRRQKNCWKNGDYMPASGLLFEKGKASNKILRLFERVRVAYLSARTDPKEYGSKWHSAVEYIRDEYDDSEEFGEELKNFINDKDLEHEDAKDATTTTAEKIYESVKNLRYSSDQVSDPFSKNFKGNVLEELLNKPESMVKFVHYAMRSDNKALKPSIYSVKDMEPDTITEGLMGLDLEVDDIPLYIIEHYGDGKDSKKVEKKVKAAMSMLELLFFSKHDEEDWDELKDIDMETDTPKKMIAKSETEKGKTDFIIPNKPMYRIFDLDDMKAIKGLSGEYVVQEKYDGMRIQIHKFENKVTIYSYNKKDITDKCPEQVEKMERKAFGDCILDAELLLFKGEESLHRADVITHIFKKKLEGATLRAHAFDVMKHEGKDLTDETLKERINIMLYQYAQHSSDALAFPSKKDTRIADSMEEVGEYAKKIMEMPTAEGVVIKDIESTYYIGKKKNPKWIKWKNYVDLDVMVLDDKKTKSGLHSYTMGVGPLTAEDTRNNKTIELDGKDYLPVGKALNTKIHVDVGTIIRVKVDEVTKKKDGFSLYSAKLIELPEVDAPDKLETLEQLSTKTKKSITSGTFPTFNPKDIINPLSIIAEMQRKDRKKLRKYIVTDYVHGEAEIICKHDVEGFTLYGFKGDELMQKNAVASMDELMGQLEKFMKSDKTKLRAGIIEIIRDNNNSMKFSDIEDKVKLHLQQEYNQVYEGKSRKLLEYLRSQDAFDGVNEFSVKPEYIEKVSEDSNMGSFEIRQREDGNLDFIIEHGDVRQSWLIDIDEPTDIYDLFGKSKKFPAIINANVRNSTKVLDSGELEFGVQKDGYHEYRLDGKKFQTRIHFRVVPLDEKQTWVAWTGTKQKMLDKDSEDNLWQLSEDKYSDLELPK